MLNRSFFSALAVAGVIFATVASAQAEVPMVKVNGQLRPAYKEGEVIVKFKDGAVRSMNQMVGLYQRVSVEQVKHFGGPFKNFEHLIFNTNHLNVDQVVYC